MFSSSENRLIAVDDSDRTPNTVLSAGRARKAKMLAIVLRRVVVGERGLHTGRVNVQPRVYLIL